MGIRLVVVRRSRYLCHERRSLIHSAIIVAGARQIATGMSIARQRSERIFVTSMCIGSGMGMAAIFVSEH